MTKTLPKLLVLLILAGLLWTGVPQPTAAQSVGTIPFGGIVVNTFPCWCSGSLLVSISPVTGSALNVFQFGFSQLFAYYQLMRPGAWVLGNTAGVAPCVVAVPFPPYCMTIGTYPLITIVGTSK